MTDRLLGQETEYAIRFRPAPGMPHPGNQTLYKAIQYGIEQCVQTRPGERAFFQDQFFVENGGAFAYEYLPHALEGGLMEGASPECSSPTELLLYQRAQESLLVKAIPLAKQNLRRQGIQGDLGLIKNCRDVKGHIYGAQENYETSIASGATLFLYRICTGLFLFLYSVFQCAYIVFLISIAVLALGGVLLAGIAHRGLYCVLRVLGSIIRFKFYKSAVQGFWRFGGKLWGKLCDFVEGDSFVSWLGKMEYTLMYPITIALYFPYTQCLHLLAFGHQRRCLEAFLVSRPIVSGAGTLFPDGTFALSEKGTAIKRLVRVSVGTDDRALFDSGNILKSMMLASCQSWLFRLAPIKRLFSGRQRLQLGLSDSNRAQFAEYLKFGATVIVLEMVEKGVLKAVPRLRQPIKALRTFVHDPTLTSRVPLRKGEPASALSLQRWYLTQAKAYVHSGVTTPMEYVEILRMWEETLDLLEEDPGKLIGRLDWVSKRYLIETAGKNEEFEVKKKIDIAYHELGRGYFDKLERTGIAPMLVTQEAVEEAIKQPSSPARVQLRSRLIRGLGYTGDRVSISWDSVRIGIGLKKKIIFLADYKRNKKIKHEK